MKQPIKKQWNLPFSLCRLAKAIGLLLAIAAFIAVCIAIIEYTPAYVWGIIVGGFAVFAIIVQAYEAVGPCE